MGKFSFPFRNVSFPIGKIFCLRKYNCRKFERTFVYSPYHIWLSQQKNRKYLSSITEFALHRKCILIPDRIASTECSIIYDSFFRVLHNIIGGGNMAIPVILIFNFKYFVTKDDEINYF